MKKIGIIIIFIFLNADCFAFTLKSLRIVYRTQEHKIARTPIVNKAKDKGLTANFEFYVLKEKLIFFGLSHDFGMNSLRSSDVYIGMERDFFNEFLFLGFRGGFSHLHNSEALGREVDLTDFRFINPVLGITSDVRLYKSLYLNLEGAYRSIAAETTGEDSRRVGGDSFSYGLGLSFRF